MKSKSLSDKINVGCCIKSSLKAGIKLINNDIKLPDNLRENLPTDRHTMPTFNDYSTGVDRLPNGF